MGRPRLYGFLSKHKNFAAQLNPFHGTQFGKPWSMACGAEMITERISAKFYGSGYNVLPS